MLEVTTANCIVVGGGVAGLAIARKLSSVMTDIFLIEKDRYIGNGITSRNSEVIHAGIYYKVDSIKNRLLNDGKDMLYGYLEDKNIPFNRCGKYIISTSSGETEELIKIKKNAQECGLEDLFFDTKRFSKLYPFINVSEALFSPSTSIVDSHSYINSLKMEFEENGGFVLVNNELKSIDLKDGTFRVLVNETKSGESFYVKTRLVLNCAGLNAVEINNMLPDEGPIFENRYVKGDYYSYMGKEKIDHLIYPIPEKDGLGVHVTIDLSGQVRFGPSAYLIDEINYEINESKKEVFVDNIKKYWPNVDESLVVPNYSGIRPKLVGNSDFKIIEKEVGGNLMISILGYESPGLTASLGLAEYIYKVCHRYAVLA